MPSTDHAPLFRLLADAVLLLHLAFVIFVVAGLVLIVAGNLWRWDAVNGMRFRVAHVAAIGVVVLQSWLGQACPLTLLESWLRVRAGGTAYGSGFIEHWVHRILFCAGPEWLFTIAYTLFGLLVALAWWYFPPKRRGRRVS